METPEKDDRHLIEQAQLNRDNFAAIFDKYFSTIHNFIYHRTGNKQLAGDLCSDAFLKAYLHLDNFKWKGIGLSSWLFRIANNEINQHFRRQTITGKIFRLFQLHEQTFQDNFQFKSKLEQTEDKNELDEKFKFVLLCLKKLPIKYQEVLSLRYFEEKSIKEIADILQKNEGTVKSLLSRGLRQLKELCHATK